MISSDSSCDKIEHIICKDELKRGVKRYGLSIIQKKENGKL